MQEEEKYNVLYVDDEEDNLLVFRSAFRRFYNIYTATSAQEGLKLLNEHNFAVIITDQRMPVTTGVEFLKTLPDEPENIRMILSGYSDVNSIIEAINTGKVYRYINKPWQREELKETIDNALEKLKNKLQRHSHLQKLEQENYELRNLVGDINKGLTGINPVAQA